MAQEELTINNLQEVPELALSDVDSVTGTVEEFMHISLINKFDLEDIMEYLKTEHKG